MARLAQAKQGQIQPGAQPFKKGGVFKGKETKAEEKAEGCKMKCGGAAKKGKK